MARYAAGDPGAFEELFRRYEPRVYVFFLRRTGSPQRAEDLYQELFLRVHRARDRYDPARQFAPWFFRIANRLLVDDYRLAFRRHEVPILDREFRTERPGIEQQLADQEQIDQLLATISPQARDVVLSTKVAGVSHPELAEHLGKSVGAVKKMASRAIQQLRSTAASMAPLDQPAG